MSTAIPIPPNIASLTAPLLLGEIFSAYLFGVLTVQTDIYHLNFPNDTRFIKAFVYIVFSLEIASSIMTISDIFHWFAAGFGSIAALGEIELSAVDTPMLGAFVAAFVQMFYCYRIYTINKMASGIAVVVALLALTEVVAGIYGAVVAEQAKTFVKAESRSKVSVYVLFISTAVTDVLIATTMIVLLLVPRDKRIKSASQSPSESRIRRILNLIVETNLASASMALLILILFTSVPNTNYFTCPSYVVAKIYSNSLLLILNNRHYLTIRGGTEEHSSGLFKMSKSHNRSGSDFPTDGSHLFAARIEVETARETLPGDSSFDYRRA